MNDHTDFWQKTSWFAIQTKPHQENVAAARVAKLDLDVFLPRIKGEKSVRCGVGLATKPLFPCYFFTRFCPLVAIEAVRYTHGVLHVVSSGQFPIPVEDGVVREIQDRVEEDGLIRIEPRGFRPGDRVSVQSGPFEGMMGRVEQELNDRKRVAIFLETLLNARVLIERSWLTAEAA
jgi:transcriptional antiterminator RfaH